MTEPPERNTWALRRGGDWGFAVAISVAYFALTLPFLSWLPLTGGMEANVVICAREAVRDGHWFPGTQNGTPRLRKPPLAHWTTAVGLLVTPGWRYATAARWPTLLMASATVGATVLLGSLVLGQGRGRAAGVVMGTMFFFLLYARKASYDTQLMLWVTLADLCLAATLFRRRKAALLGAGVAIGIGVMTKGPVALLLTAFPAAAFALLRHQRRWDNAGAADEGAMEPQARPPGGAWSWAVAGVAGATLMFAIALPWAIVILRRYPEMLDIWVGQVSRRSERGRGGGSWLSYFGILPLFWPWLVWFLAGAAAAVRGRDPQARRAVSMVLWVAAPLAVMTLFPGRRARYALPLIAPAAVVAAYGLQRFAAATTRAADAIRAAHWIGLAAPMVLLAAACAAGWGPLRAADGGRATSLGAAALVAGAVGCVAWLAARRTPGPLPLLLGSAACVALAYPLAIRAYARMPSAVPETDAFIGAIVAAHPDAVYYSSRARYHDPPLEMVIYADRVLWNIGADLGAVRPADREQVLLRHEPRGIAPVPAPFRPIGGRVIDGDWWGAYLLPPTPAAPPPVLPPVPPGSAGYRLIR